MIVRYKGVADVRKISKTDFKDKGFETQGAIKIDTAKSREVEVEDEAGAWLVKNDANFEEVKIQQTDLAPEDDAILE